MDDGWRLVDAMGRRLRPVHETDDELSACAFSRYPTVQASRPKRLAVHRAQPARHSLYEAVGRPAPLPDLDCPNRRAVSWIVKATVIRLPWTGCCRDRMTLFFLRIG
jgi:hypothetical protein